MTYSAHRRQSVQLLSASISNDIHHTGLPLCESGEMKISLDFFDSKMQIEHKLFIIILSDVKYKQIKQTTQWMTWMDLTTLLFA